VDTRSREELLAENTLLRERLTLLETEVEMLRSLLSGGGKGSSAAPFIKPNREQRREAERADRKKRKKSFGRRRDIPTERVEHVVETCPDCGRRLQGGWVHSTRQTIEIPETPIRIVEHVLIARRCGVCGKVHVPSLSASDGVIGKHRVGPRLMSLISTLCTVKRMPHRMVQRLLEGLYGVHLSLGEITEILHKVAGFGRGLAASILREIRGSPLAHADETGWREDGVNGYLWSLSTPSARYYHFNRSRGSAVADRLLGLCFAGVLVCDFYGGYNFYDGPIQRCWVHFRRDLKKLVEAHPDDASVRAWVELVRQIGKSAEKAARRDLSKAKRSRLRLDFEGRLMALATPYLKDQNAPQRVLANRIGKHLSELFTFMELPGCPSGNNAAERAIRPAVIARKVSGGTRSANGSQTRTTLMSIFGTWALQGRDPLKACTDMILAAQTATT
jgi:hypothetical protein